MQDTSATYQEFYGLAQLPFRVYPDPAALYWSRHHAEAYATLQRGLAAGVPVALLTGEAGTGKTTLVNRLMRDLPKNVTGVRVPPAIACRGEPVDWLLAAFGQSGGGEAPAARHVRFRELVFAVRAAGGRVLLVLDEAQAIAAGHLEELRLLAGFEEAEEAALQMLLVGRPALRRQLSGRECAALAQRVAADARLRALTPAETAEYIGWRLLAAGAAETAFTDDAAALVHEATLGVPRLINVLCDQALGLGCAEGTRRIGPALLERVLDAAARRGSFGRFQPLAPTQRLAG